ncbi:unnamed protein product [Notodromas monacha]|uniref:Innexin n=1 Tax=Notodromas monacha TaxID=399045 RepID=A0A7R9BUD4_9CRUS|nr:unnamed protein product [Notodromas monacha]CAG0920529.1 unnamed protein product [Notodromas monacha]
MVLLETLALLGSLHGLEKFGAVAIDGFTFKLHYRFTCSAIFGLSLLLSATELIGSKIDCMSSAAKDASAQRFMDSYCFSMGTKTVTHLYEPRVFKGSDRKQLPRVGVHVLAPGVGPRLDRTLDPKTSQDYFTQHKFYLWIPFVLLVSGVSFRVPREIWKALERGKLRSLLKEHVEPENRKLYVMKSEKERENATDRLADYLISSHGSHTWYLVRYLGAQLLNLVVVVMNILLMDKFLAGRFVGLGVEYLKYSAVDDEERIDPLIKVFPRVAACDFHTVGVSGTIVNNPAICILAMNIFAEKVFFFLWWWFFFVLIPVTSASLLHWVWVATSAARRTQLLMSKSRRAEPTSVNAVVYQKMSNVGDFFLLLQLSLNMPTEAFSQLIDVLASSDKLRQHQQQRRRRDDDADSASAGRQQGGGNNAFEMTSKIMTSYAHHKVLPHTITVE